MAVQSISAAADRVMSVLISGLEIEFGHGAGEALAHRFLEAEEAEFHWDARVEERWIAPVAQSIEEDLELDYVRIVGCLNRRWYVAVMIVDGDGNAHGMSGLRHFRGRIEALKAFADA